MADSKLSALGASTPAITDEFYVNNGGVEKKVTQSDLTVSGAFSPTIYGLSTTGTQGYAIQDGLYSRIGNIVFVQIGIELNATSGASGVLVVGNLPFITGIHNYSFSVGSYSNITLTSGHVMKALTSKGIDYVPLYEADNTGATGLSASLLTSTTSIYISGTYTV